MRGGIPIGAGHKRLALLLLLNLCLMPMVAMGKETILTKVKDTVQTGLHHVDIGCQKVGRGVKNVAEKAGMSSSKCVLKQVDKEVQKVWPFPYNHYLYGAGLLLLGYRALRPRRIITVTVTPTTPSYGINEIIKGLGDDDKAVFLRRVGPSESRDKSEWTSSNPYVIVGCILAVLFVIGGVGAILYYRRKDGSGDVQSKKVIGKDCSNNTGASSRTSDDAKSSARPS